MNDEVLAKANRLKGRIQKAENKLKKLKKLKEISPSIDFLISLGKEHLAKLKAEYEGL